MKIVLFEVEPRETAAFDHLAKDNPVALVEAPLRSANAPQHADAEIISTFIYSKLDAEVLRQFPALKLIATRSTGYDHIDVEYCATHGIRIANVPSYGENTVAEHVFALLLAISHRLPEAIARTRSGNFSPEGLQGFDLAGKTMGVVGTGNIGRHVLRIAKGFAMDIIAYDIKPDCQFACQLGFRYVGLDELWSRSDIVTLHVPATAESHHLLRAETVARMKDGVIVINTARGSLIDPAALIEGLRSGKIAGAGLDVLPDEPMIREEAELISSIFQNRHDLRGLVADHILIHLPNVIVTPHSAFNTREAVHRIALTTASNIAAFLSGKPQNLVTEASPQ